MMREASKGDVGDCLRGPAKKVANSSERMYWRWASLALARLAALCATSLQKAANRGCEADMAGAANGEEVRAGRVEMAGRKALLNGDETRCGTATDATKAIIGGSGAAISRGWCDGCEVAADLKQSAAQGA